MEPDIVELFLRMSCLRRGNAVAGGSSGIVTEYECRMLGIINKILLWCINTNFKKQPLWMFSHQIFQDPSCKRLNQETISTAVRDSNVSNKKKKHRALTDSHNQSTFHKTINEGSCTQTQTQRTIPSRVKVDEFLKKIDGSGLELSDYRQHADPCLFTTASPAHKSTAAARIRRH